jgi:hypothetical protein
MKSLSFPLPIGVVVVALASLTGAYWAVPTWKLDLGSKRTTVELREQADGDYEFPDKTDLSLVLARWQSEPLFAEKRKIRNPSESAEVMPEGPQISIIEDIQTPVHIRFIGFIAKDGDKAGLFRDEQTGEETWVAVGEMLGNWTLAELSQTRAKFNQQGTFFSLDMFP